MTNQTERDKTVKHLTEALTSIVLAQQAATKGGITYDLNEPNDIAIAEHALKEALRKVKASYKNYHFNTLRKCS
jgi:transposase